MKKGKNNSADNTIIDLQGIGNLPFRAPEQSQNVTAHFVGNGYLFARFLAYLFGCGFLYITFPAVDNFRELDASFPQALFAEWITLFPFLLTGFFNASELLYLFSCVGLGYLTGFSMLLFQSGVYPVLSGKVVFFVSHLTPVFLFPVHRQRPFSAKLLDALLLLLSGLLGALIKYLFLFGH